MALPGSRRTGPAAISTTSNGFGRAVSSSETWMAPPLIRSS